MAEDTSEESRWPGTIMSQTQHLQSELSSCRGRNGLLISSGDYVHMISTDPHVDTFLIAKIESVYEDVAGRRILYVRWFYKAEDLKHEPPSQPRPKEVYHTNLFDTQLVDSVVGHCHIVSKSEFFNLNSSSSSSAKERVDGDTDTKRKNTYFCEYSYYAEKGAFTLLRDGPGDPSTCATGFRYVPGPTRGTAAVAKELAEVIINVERSIPKDMLPPNWPNYRRAWIIKARDAKTIKEVAQSLVDLEEGVRILHYRKSQSSKDHAAWKKTVSNIHTYELLSKYVKLFKEDVMNMITKMVTNTVCQKAIRGVDQGFKQPSAMKRKPPLPDVRPGKVLKIGDGTNTGIEQVQIRTSQPTPDDRIEPGSFYEIDNGALPQDASADLKILRVVLVSEKTRLHVSFKYPSSDSLNNYFGKDAKIPPSMGTKPILDSQCNMTPKQAERAITRLVSSTEHLHQGHTWNFWVVEKTGEDEDNHPEIGVPGETFESNDMELTGLGVVPAPSSNQEVEDQFQRENYGGQRDGRLLQLTQVFCNFQGQTSGKKSPDFISPRGFSGDEKKSDLKIAGDESDDRNDINPETSKALVLRDLGPGIQAAAEALTQLIPGNGNTRISREAASREIVLAPANTNDEPERNLIRYRGNDVPIKWGRRKRVSFGSRSGGTNSPSSCDTTSKDGSSQDRDRNRRENRPNNQPQEQQQQPRQEQQQQPQEQQQQQPQLPPTHANVTRDFLRSEKSPSRSQPRSEGRLITNLGSTDIVKETENPSGGQDRSSRSINKGKAPMISSPSNDADAALDLGSGKENPVPLPLGSGGSKGTGAMVKSVGKMARGTILRLPKDMQGRWSRERYKSAQYRLIEIMHDRGAVPGRPILRPDLRAEARKHIGDTGLLDHLLKHMTDTVVSNGERFRRRHNSVGAMEYWLEDAGWMEQRRAAGVEDPSWLPPPGHRSADALPESGQFGRWVMSPAEVADVKKLKEETEKLQRELRSLILKMKSSNGSVNLPAAKQMIGPHDKMHPVTHGHRSEVIELEEGKPDTAMMPLLVDLTAGDEEPDTNNNSGLPKQADPNSDREASRFKLMNENLERSKDAGPSNDPPSEDKQVSTEELPSPPKALQDEICNMQHSLAQMREDVMFITRVLGLSEPNETTQPQNATEDPDPAPEVPLETPYKTSSPSADLAVGTTVAGEGEKSIRKDENLDDAPAKDRPHNAPRPGMLENNFQNGFKICKPAGSFMWPSMSLESSPTSRGANNFRIEDVLSPRDYTTTGHQFVGPVGTNASTGSAHVIINIVEGRLEQLQGTGQHLIASFPPRAPNSISTGDHERMLFPPPANHLLGEVHRQSWMTSSCSSNQEKVLHQSALLHSPFQLIKAGAKEDAAHQGLKTLSVAAGSLAGEKGLLRATDKVREVSTMFQNQNSIMLPSVTSHPHISRALPLETNFLAPLMNQCVPPTRPLSELAIDSGKPDKSDGEQSFMPGGAFAGEKLLARLVEPSFDALQHVGVRDDPVLRQDLDLSTKLSLTSYVSPAQNGSTSNSCEALYGGRGDTVQTSTAHLSPFMVNQSVRDLNPTIPTFQEPRINLEGALHGQVAAGTKILGEKRHAQEINAVKETTSSWLGLAPPTSM